VQEEEKYIDKFFLHHSSLTFFEFSSRLLLEYGRKYSSCSSLACITKSLLAYEYWVRLWFNFMSVSGECTSSVEVLFSNAGKTRKMPCMIFAFSEISKILRFFLPTFRAASWPSERCRAASWPSERCDKNWQNNYSKLQWRGNYFRTGGQDRERQSREREIWFFAEIGLFFVPKTSVL